ncbi:MAG: response regulator transcription factor [Ignavibacteriales bacterium]|nr:response regulator transcription factor [Ignavibacteriales bacterium]
MIKVIIVEDNAPIREGLCTLISGTPDFSCVGTFSDCETLLQDIKKIKFDIILMDIGLPGMNGIEGTKKIKEIYPDANILVLTIYEDNDIIFDALCSGASGYLVKKTSPSKLLESIAEAYQGGSPMSSHIARKVIDLFKKKYSTNVHTDNYNLSEREKEVLELLSKGNNYSEIGNQLFICLDTVRHHIRNIYKKLHVHSQSEAIAKAMRDGIIS